MPVLAESICRSRMVSAGTGGATDNHVSATGYLPFAVLHQKAVHTSPVRLDLVLIGVVTIILLAHEFGACTLYMSPISTLFSKACRSRAVMLHSDSTRCWP